MTEINAMRQVRSLTRSRVDSSGVPILAALGLLPYRNAAMLFGCPGAVDRVSGQRYPLSVSLPCPSCGAAMASAPEFGEAVSGCRTCCGLWLSNEASVAVAQGNLHPEVVALAARVDAHLPERAEGEGGYRRQAAVALRRCPRCDALLSPVVISRQRIELDVCEAHGTWFDRNELRTVLTALTIEREERVQAHEQERQIEAAGQRANSFPSADVLAALLEG